MSLRPNLNQQLEGGASSHVALFVDIALALALRRAWPHLAVGLSSGIHGVENVRVLHIDFDTHRSH